MEPLNPNNHTPIEEFVYYEETGEIPDQKLEELEQWAMQQGILEQTPKGRLLTTKGLYAMTGIGKAERMPYQGMKDVKVLYTETWNDDPGIPDSPAPETIWKILLFAFGVLCFLIYLIFFL